MDEDQEVPPLKSMTSPERVLRAPKDQLMQRTYITLEVSDGTDTASDDISIQVVCDTDLSGDTTCFTQPGS